MKTFLTLVIACLSLSIVLASPTTNVDPIKYYEEAFDNIKKMLKGEIPLSFRDAIFLTENAYKGGNLSYLKYRFDLSLMIQDIEIIREKLSLNYDYFDKSNVYTNAAIFQYFTDTLIYQDSLGNLIREKYPYQYNFEDPLGEKDWTNMFVSNLLETEKGNCHSLPYLYQIIANEFGVSSHLVIAPNHLYITHLCHDPSITWYNTELTSGTHPIDGWIKVSTYMTMDAIKSGIYGLPLDEKQSVALALVDLANGYIRRFPDANKMLAIDCVDLALEHFPMCISAMLLKLDLLGKEYQRTEDKGTKEMINELATQIHQLGYDEMPRQMYEDWLGGKREYDPNYKPFKAFNEQKNQEYRDLIDKPLLTTSNGRYLEYHWTDSLELIGNFIYDTKRKKVTQILKIDTSDIVSRIPRDILGRWLSPDPKMSKYPNMSPYNGFANNPIIYVDPDGRDNIIFLLVLNGVDGGKATKIMKLTNQYLKENLKLNTRVVLVNESDYRTLDGKDKNDLVAVLGKDRDHVKSFVSEKVPHLEQLSTLGQWEKEDERNFPELSENSSIPGMDNNADLIAISYKGAKGFGEDNYTGEVEAVSFIILHGAGHNVGLGHDLGGTDIMDKGSTVKMIMRIGNGQTTYLDGAGAIHEHDESMITQYKDNSSLGTLTGGDRNKKYTESVRNRLGNNKAKDNRYTPDKVRQRAIGEALKTGKATY